MAGRSEGARRRSFERDRRPPRIVQLFAEGTSTMKIVRLIARLLMGLEFTVFGLNGFLHFIPMKLPEGVAGQFLGAMFESKYIYAIAVLQLVGGVLLLVNRYVPLRAHPVRAGHRQHSALSHSDGAAGVAHRDHYGPAVAPGLFGSALGVRRHLRTARSGVEFAERHLTEWLFTAPSTGRRLSARSARRGRAGPAATSTPVYSVG